MPMFLVYLEGAGEGCDYTIACNQKLTQLKAQTLEAATAEVVAMNLTEIKRARIIEASLIQPVDVDQWKRDAAEAQRKAESARAEARERAELERLSKKYPAECRSDKSAICRVCGQEKTIERGVVAREYCPTCGV